jgi:RNA polymerase sigma-70 factor (ECF subfamily)
MNEAELIAAARAGDEEAFRLLYEQHAAYVRAIGRSVLRTKDLDDMCQETFMRAFTRLSNYAGDCNFRTWITRVAMNYCLMALRRAEPAGENALSSTTDPDDEEGGHEWAFGSRDRALDGVPARLDVTRLLQTLKPRQRKLLEMAYLESVPDGEIAADLGISLFAVRSGLHYARQKLRTFPK